MKQLADEVYTLQRVPVLKLNTQQVLNHPNTLHANEDNVFGTMHMGVVKCRCYEFLFAAPPSSPRLLLTGNGVPQVRQSSITVCWLPALDTGGLDDLRYNIYLYDTTDPDSEFNKLNDEGVVQEEGGDNQTSICYELEDIDTQTSYGIIVVAANGVTGDPLLLSDLDQVQGRSVVFFLTLGEDLVPDGGSSSNGDYLIVYIPV